MDQNKLCADFSNDISNDTEIAIPPLKGASEIRTLTELELMTAGGGDGITVW